MNKVFNFFTGLVGLSSLMIGLELKADISHTGTISSLQNHLSIPGDVASESWSWIQVAGFMTSIGVS